MDFSFGSCLLVVLSGTAVRIHPYFCFGVSYDQKEEGKTGITFFEEGDR